MTITITCRRPADLVAAAIGVLGFVPQNSVVMLTFGVGARFHARVDLNPNHQSLCQALLHPVLRHSVTDVAFIVFAQDDVNIEESRRLLAFLAAGFGARDVNLVASPLIVAGDNIHHQDGTTERCDWRSSPAVAALVADGRRIESSRDALNDRVKQTSNALTEGPEFLANLLRDLLDGEKRDSHWMELSRELSREQVEYWLDVTRRSPHTHAAAPSAIAGFAAWLSGDGALAWICVDRARQADPGSRLAELLAEVLTRCIDPARWDDIRSNL